MRHRKNLNTRDESGKRSASEDETNVRHAKRPEGTVAEHRKRMKRIQEGSPNVSDENVSEERQNKK